MTKCLRRRPAPSAAADREELDGTTLRPRPARNYAAFFTALRGRLATAADELDIEAACEPRTPHPTLPERHPALVLSRR